MTFSIIVPIYRVEKYIDECVHSVLSQDYSDYEIVLVDDGSPDYCPKICDKYSSEYENIKTIHKENGGLSDARNVGLNSASGDYVIFLDSDDYWNDKSFLNNLSNIIQRSNPDLIVFGYKKILDGKEIANRVLHSDSKGIQELTLAGEYNICAWDKVIKRNVLVDNDIQFRKGVFSEDMEWCSLIFKNVSNVEVLNGTPHSYRQREGSITKKLSVKNIQDVKENFERCLDIRKDLDADKQNTFDYYLSKNISMFMIALSQLSKNEQKNYYDFIKDNSCFLKKSTRNREKILYLVEKIFGVVITEKILGIVYGVK